MLLPFYNEINLNSIIYPKQTMLLIYGIYPFKNKSFLPKYETEEIARISKK